RFFWLRLLRLEPVRLGLVRLGPVRLRLTRLCLLRLALVRLRLVRLRLVAGCLTGPWRLPDSRFGAAHLYVQGGVEPRSAHLHPVRPAVLQRARVSEGAR